MIGAVSVSAAAADEAVDRFEVATCRCPIYMVLDQYVHQLCFLHGIANHACRISWSVKVPESFRPIPIKNEGVQRAAALLTNEIQLQRKHCRQPFFNDLEESGKSSSSPRLLDFLGGHAMTV